MVNYCTYKKLNYETVYIQRSLNHFLFTIVIRNLVSDFSRICNLSVELSGRASTAFSLYIDALAKSVFFERITYREDAPKSTQISKED